MLQNKTNKNQINGGSDSSNASSSVLNNGSNSITKDDDDDADVFVDDADRQRHNAKANSFTHNSNGNSNSSSSSNMKAGQTVVVDERRHRNRCYVSLACSIGSMGLACGSLMQIPNTTDRITLQRGLFLTSLGFIYFISLTDFCNQYFLETRRGLQFRKKYRLMMSDVLEITNKIVSAIQAFFSFLVGFIVCKSTCSKSFVYASHFLMEAYGWFGTAYFMYDIWSMYKVHTQKIADKLKLMKSKTLKANGNHYRTSTKTTNGHLMANGSLQLMYDKAANGGSGNGSGSGNMTHKRHHEDEIYDYDGACVQIPKDGRWDFLKYVVTHPVMMIHHVFIGTFGLLVVTYIRGGGHCIYSYMFMMEFSTPFVSLRSILSTMGLKESRVYIINGLLMLGSFFFCRVFMWPYVMWRYSLAIDASFWQALTGLPNGCIISILILFLPQIYWFFLMVKGALKVLLPAGKSRPKQQQQQQLNAAGDRNMTTAADQPPPDETLKKFEISRNDSRQTELLCQAAAALGENSAN